MFKRILVALDGSDGSHKALTTAIDIAEQCKSEKLTLLHVLSMEYLESLQSIYTYGLDTINQSTSAVTSPAYQENIQMESRKAAETMLTSAEKLVKARGVPVDTMLKTGHLVTIITKTAKTNQSDLIVMGSKGQSNVKQILLGSVSNGVMREASCPVLVVR